MLIAKEKKQNNIAEYILYMWQLEDLVRAFKFDIDLIKKHIINTMTESSDLKKEIELWYSDIIQMMQMEKLENTGHLQVVKNVIIDLDGLHASLLNDNKENEYISFYKQALPNIIELSEKIKSENESEVHTMFHGLYALLLMRMKKREVGEATTEAMDSFSKLLSLLAKKYQEREKKERTQWDS